MDAGTETTPGARKDLQPILEALLTRGIGLGTIALTIKRCAEFRPISFRQRQCTQPRVLSTGTQIAHTGAPQQAYAPLAVELRWR